MRVICTAGSSALEYTHAFISAYTADHLRGAVAQRLSVGAYELLSNALNFGSVSSDIVLELIEAGKRIILLDQEPAQHVLNHRVSSGS